MTDFSRLSEKSGCTAGLSEYACYRLMILSTQSISYGDSSGYRLTIITAIRAIAVAKANQKCYLYKLKSEDSTDMKMETGQVNLRMLRRHESNIV